MFGIEGKYVPINGAALAKFKGQFDCNYISVLLMDFFPVNDCCVRGTFEYVNSIGHSEGQNVFFCHAHAESPSPPSP